MVHLSSFSRVFVASGKLWEWGIRTLRWSSNGEPTQLENLVGGKASFEVVEIISIQQGDNLSSINVLIVSRVTTVTVRYILTSNLKQRRTTQTLSCQLKAKGMKSFQH